MEISEIKEKFVSVCGNYSRLGKNLEEAVLSFLEEEKIPFLNIYHRVKEFNSFDEKIKRKHYKNPFDEIEDICGLRIICYYASDIIKIENIIDREFHVLESEDKSNSLGLKEFAYRSVHKIVKIKNNWTATPNYRGLEDLKVEIQIRTILMHAWAEVEHKLNYKNDDQVPVNFQRKLFRLSAKFEEADEQFEELRNGISDYRKTIVANAKIENKFDINQDFNLDSLLAFLNFHFPDIPKIEPQRLDNSFEQLKKHKINFKELEQIIDKFNPYFNEISQDLKESGYASNIIEMPTELIAFATHVLKRRKYDDTMLTWKNVVEKWIKKIDKL
ncbi:ppGpp synthetase catalytic domain-containing protein (RelA/SpoT-type nucleotidyltranferase) [Flavobacterium resistens]|uniref:(P)ppGpp synthetase n=1 Tax=Flavobacterium resistens TaxID=443612 RepID=A0A521BHF3_9FLAO|nr:(p)ppGpp synthetase [Flavobacterium resistens]MRX67378.1 (p)ppGpp synthetase [Flavobacterium resistens]SMO46502.1 ppGpp synthetase catalytic domain-containing protein (RelA/SpoT-type nucleotidyltranferase) [Flavobacterium resistens]